MRINLNAGIGTTETTLDKTASSRPAASAPTLGESHFTPHGVSVSNLAARALAAPEIRQEKVEVLRAQVTNGTYQVSSAQIAASIFAALRVGS